MTILSTLKHRGESSLPINGKALLGGMEIPTLKPIEHTFSQFSLLAYIATVKFVEFSPHYTS